MALRPDEGNPREALRLVLEEIFALPAVTKREAMEHALGVSAGTRIGLARKSTNMQRIRDVIRLRLETGVGERQVSRALNSSRTVVARTLAQFRPSRLEPEATKGLSDSGLEQG